MAFVLNIHNLVDTIVSPSLMTETLTFFRLPIASFKHSQYPFSKTAITPLKSNLVKSLIILAENCKKVKIKLLSTVKKCKIYSLRLYLYD